MINSVISAILVYYLPIFRMLVNAINMIDKVHKNFQWRGPRGNQESYYLTRWEVVCKSKSTGGLVITSLKNMNIAMLIKWLWKLVIEAPCFGSQSYVAITSRGGDPTTLTVSTLHYVWNIWLYNFKCISIILPNYKGKGLHIDLHVGYTTSLTCAHKLHPSRWSVIVFHALAKFKGMSRMHLSLVNTQISLFLIFT